MGKRWKNPDKRMARAVELRAQGWSLRRIGTELAVSEMTIRRDLARWEGMQSEGDCQVIVATFPVRHVAPMSQGHVAQMSQFNRTKEEGA